MPSSNPWDIPPNPQLGDDSEDVTYLSIGRALSRWEFFEWRLFWVFTAFVGIGRNYTYPAERAYGSIATFRGRLDMISAAAEIYFLISTKPSFPKLEVDSKKLFKDAANYAARRNEIAHGIVMKYSQAEYTNPHTGFVLTAPIYASNKNHPSYHGNSFPKYFYSSKEIDTFGERFMSLAPRAEDIVDRIRGRKP